jgi:hypothetical protein
MISAQTPAAFVARESRYPLFGIMLNGPANRIFPLQLSTDGRSHASAQCCLAAKRLIGRGCAPQQVDAGA